MIMITFVTEAGHWSGVILDQMSIILVIAGVAAPLVNIAMMTPLLSPPGTCYHSTVTKFPGGYDPVIFTL